MKIRTALICFFMLCLGMSSLSFASSANDAVAYDQWQSQLQSQQELQEIEEKLQAAYESASQVLANDKSETDRLSREQMAWDKTRQAQALSRGAPGSHAYNQELVRQAKKRIDTLEAITAKGYIETYHEYQLAPGQAMTGFMRVWQYEDGHAHLIIRTRHEEQPGYCEINTESARHENGVITFTLPGRPAVTGTVMPYDQGYRARVETTGHVDACTKEADIAGQYIRTDMPIPAKETDFEKVATCNLGQGGTRTLRILRNQPVAHSHIYYIEDKDGLRPLSLYAGERVVKPYEALEHSRGSQVRVRCIGNGEKVLLITGEFWSNFINIFTFRYNTPHQAWQILYTAQRGEPSLVYLNDREIRLIIPDPEGASPRYAVRRHLVEKGYSRYDDQGNSMDADSLPDPAGFAIITVRDGTTAE
ncbi:hypothetical protein LJC19_06540 [Oxalobacter sp. OttesenSCG-928-P03]|nr:hypothetical protein [Oxalobacter sp. OttesenSCG-928-P03]